MASVALSTRQLELLKAVVEVTKTDVDWTLVAARASFKTSKYARDSWTGVKKKLGVSEDGKLELSARQYDLVKAYIELMQGATDWAAVATRANFKTSKYARDSWTGVKNKLSVTGGAKTVVGGDDAAGATGAGEVAAATVGTENKKPGSRKRKADTMDDGEDLTKDNSTTKKAKKATGRKQKAISPVLSESSPAPGAQKDVDGQEVQADADNDAEEDEVVVKPEVEDEEFF